MHTMALALTLVSALRVPGPLSPRNANYRLQATLDEHAHVVRGKAILNWRNPAATPAGELVFHLYLNAFKNEATTFFRESQGRHRRAEAAAHGWGALTVQKVILDGNEVTARLAVDETLARLPLSRAVPPDGTVEVIFEFEARMPRVFSRTGWAEDFFAVAQWYPKIAVFDGAWRAHRFHVANEFFADFGVYDVELDVPGNFTVGASGVITGEERRDGRKRVRVRAEDVHDFAWFASPRFVPVEKMAGDVRVVLLGWPENRHSAQRHLEAAAVALDEMGLRFAPYPYSQLTVIDVPLDALGAGGMEYPTLVTTLSAPLPRGVRFPELVTVHEVAHQWFQGMVASDEVATPWLDEGLTESMTDAILTRRFGAVYDFAGHRLEYGEASRLSYRRSFDVDRVDQAAFAFLDLDSYGALSYAKTNLIVRTLENLEGEARVAEALRRYVEENRFRHPGRAEFLNAFKNFRTRSILQRALDGTDVADYGILRVAATAARAPAGLFESDGGLREAAPSPGGKPSAWHSEVVVHRRGTLALPVEVRVAFEGGAERRERWDDDGSGTPWRRFEYDGPQPVAFAEVDPAHTLALEVDRLDNGLRRESDAGPRRRAVAMVARALSIALSLVGF